MTMPLLTPMRRRVLIAYAAVVIALSIFVPWRAHVITNNGGTSTFGHALGYAPVWSSPERDPTDDSSSFVKNHHGYLVVVVDSTRWVMSIASVTLIAGVAFVLNGSFMLRNDH